MCNNGAIVGQSLGVQGNSYISQLNVTITPETAGKTISCVYDALTSNQTQNMIKFSTVVPSTYLQDSPTYAFNSISSLCVLL
jgi:hypothetical protein